MYCNEVLLASQLNIDGETRRMRKKNRIKRKKTKVYNKYILLVRF